jgi:hypothetical protein
MNAHLLPFERFRYWQGQQLRSRDFTDQIAEVDRLTRWHNRAVHEAFGVRSGFDVRLVETAQPPAVRVDCGVAYDCTGAMLVLQRSRELSVPALEPGGSIVLLVRSRQSGGSFPVTAPGPATGSGRLWEDDLVFGWTRRSGGDPREGVPLVRVFRDQGGQARVDLRVRASARPLARPRLGSGATIPGLTPWEPWLRGVQTRVDTSAAGFTQLPAYFATWLATRTSSAAEQLRFFLAFTHVAEPGLTEFTFRVVLPPGVQRLPIGIPEIARDLGLVVCWLGCQAAESVPQPCPGQRSAQPECSQDDGRAG